MVADLDDLARAADDDEQLILGNIGILPSGM